ncbi:CQS_1a_G0051020.mRNA.1.CDS.1 [Saccharomyces cerevisiae]|nr:CQS_1a_G0051020.mRNA.1.CDS.1 [Saccharomyces cerevisiae]CAI7465028.1 CQS_1a_G0051020.mRNA.1.CDS.1 [Saccharomyces cerevisiae]
MSSDSNAKPLPFIYQFISGAVAGISELTVMYPLDVVKTRFQLEVTTPTATAVGRQVERYNGVIDCLKKIVKKEGFSRLYRGISSPMLMEAPKRATKFACNDQYQKIFKNLFNTNETTQKISIAAGASAGMTEAAVIVPFELIKIRMQDVKSSYLGPMDCLKKTIKNEGIMGLYKGIESTMWRNALWNGGYFGVIYQVRNSMPVAKTKGQKTRNDLIAGAIGGTVGTMLNTPFDVVKSRIQSVDAVSSAVKKYNWCLPSLLVIYREEGFRALYKGFVPKVCRLAPGGSLMLVVFTGMMNFFRDLKYGH